MTKRYWYKRRKYRKYKRSKDKKQDKELKKIKKLLPSVTSKYFDYAVSNQAVTYNGSLITGLMAVSRGTGDTDRVGDAVRMLRMECKIASFSTGAGGDNIRFTFFIDKSPYIASTAALYKVTGTDLATLSPLQEDYRNDIIVLKDFRVPVNSVNNVIINTDFTKSLNKIVRYAGATATPVTNYIKFAAISDAAAPVCQYDMYMRIYYVDA